MIVIDAPADGAEPALGVECDFDVPDLPPLLHSRGETLQPILDPFDRAVQQQSRGRDHDLFRMKHGFRPEAAADVRRDDAELMLGKSQRLRHYRLGAMRSLRAVPHREEVFVGVVARDNAARFDGEAAAFLHAKLFGEAMRGRSKDTIDVAVFDDMLGGQIVRAIKSRTRRVGL